MSDIAQLGISVDSSSVRATTKDLMELEREAARVSHSLHAINERLKRERKVSDILSVLRHNKSTNLREMAEMIADAV